MSKLRTEMAVMLFAFCSLLCAGCVQGDVRMFVKYEPKDDSFRYMEVYTNIHATEKRDLDSLQSLWEHRRSIIINPVDLHLFGRNAFEREGKHMYRSIALGGYSPRRDPAKKEREVKGAPEVKVTSVDLDTIKVVPGKFYLNAHGNLSCYHQIEVPGKTIDALIKEVAIPSIVKFVTESAQHHIQFAGKEKAKRLTWDDFRKAELKRMFEKDPPKTDPKKEDAVEEFGPLEIASLRLLLKAGTDKSVRLSRNRDVFTLLVPLSKMDCQEVIVTVDLIRDTLAERIKAGKSVGEGLPEALASFKLRYVEGAGLEVSADNSKLAKAGKDDVDPQPNEKMTLGCKKTVAAVQERGIEIDKTFSIQKLVAEYVGK